MSAKTKLPRALALDVARELVASLKLGTDRLVIAGSLRRRKAEARGWTWKPYDRGFLDGSGEWIPVNCEEDVFGKLGLPYLDPWQR